MRYFWLAFPLLIALSACTTTGGGGDGARQAVSQEPAGSEQRQRAKVHYELGALYLQDGRFAVALEEARIALSVDPDYAPAYSLLGLTHMFLDEPKLAENNFENALRRAPGDPEISNNYGWFLCQTGREAKSIDYFLAAARNPFYATPTKPYTNAGICAIRLKDDKAAEAHLRRALQLDPVNTQAMYWMADLTFRQGRVAEARQWMTELEKISELNAPAIWLALRIERQLGNRDGEARHGAQLRRNFANSVELGKLLQGTYE